jgi:hypothetical protein
MNDELKRSYGRWHDAEAGGRDDEADAAFASVFQAAVSEPLVSSRLTAVTMQAVAAAVERDARRARRIRAVSIPVAAVCALAVMYFSAGYLAAAFSTGVVWVLDVLIAAGVGMATEGPGRADPWSVVTSLGRAAAALLGKPAFTVTMVAIQGVAIAALVALQRLLRSDQEFLR